MDSLSRSPSDYRPDPNGHFRRRVDERDIPPVVWQMAIEGGEVEEQDNGNVCLKTTYLGYDFEVIVNPDKGFVITAYSTDDW